MNVAIALAIGTIGSLSVWAVGMLAGAQPNLLVLFALFTGLGYFHTAARK